MKADNIDIDLQDLSDADKAVLDLLKSRQSAMKDRVMGWSAVNTGSWNADGLNAFSKLLAQALSETQAQVDFIPTQAIEKVNDKGEMSEFQSGPVVRAQARKEAPMQVILTGHYDTVFPPGTFETIKDLGEGKMGGPGLADMKGGITVMIEALKAFEACGDKEKLGYTIILSPDEEIGNFASNPMIMDAAKDAHIGLTFEPSMEDGSMVGGRKGSAVFDIVFHGRSAHAGRNPEDGNSALMAAAQFALEIEALNGQYEGVTLNVGSIDGGDAVNIVPALAVVRMGVRAPDSAAADWATQKVRAAYENALERRGITGHFHGGFYRPPKPRNAAQNKLISDVTLTGKALGLSLTFRDTGGVCEGNNVFAAGTPNIDTLGVRGGRIHSSEEFMVTESLSERAGLAALILNRIADGRIDAKTIKKLMKN
ncbi:MAG: hydrolase [Litorimonas sp.]